MAPPDTVTPNLWDIARKRLTHTEEARLAKAAVDNNTLSQQLLELVQGKQQQCMDRRWKFKRSNGEVVVIRDVFEKVVRWLQRFKEVGDVATQYDPAHAALPWAGVRMLLQIAINDAESLGTIAEGIETVSSLITRCAVLETIHLPPHRYPLSKAHATLQDALVALYTAILSWLSVAGAYYEKHLIKRLLRSIVFSGPTLTLIFQEERKVSQLASSLHDQLASTTAEAVDVLNVSFNSLMSMLRDLQQPVLRVAGALDRMEQSLEAKERQQLVEWLSVVRPLEVHRKVHRGLVENTGEWLLQRKEYAEWCKSTASSSLWLRGVPGCGKSKLTSLVVQEHIGRVCRGSDIPPVAFCYCSRSGIDGIPSSPLTVMGCILKQLAFLGPSRDIHPSVWNEFSQRVKDAQALEPSPLSLDDCQNLITLITADRSVTIIIDGLDETEGDVRDLLNTLQHIIDESQNIVKLFVSSRDDIPVKTHLQHANSIRITNADNARDVSAFVKAKVSAAVQDKRLLEGRVSPELEMRVIQTLTRGSREMFLWASLNLEQLCGPEFEMATDVINKLEALRTPNSLLETLEQMYWRVQKYAPVAKQITKTVFRWLLVAERQLSISELMEIIRLTVSSDMEELDEGHIKSLCRGFISSENDSDSFVLAHEAIREFLLGQDEFFYGQDGILEHLLDRGVDPNILGGRFKTPIQGAAVRGHPSTVGILLRHGADPLLEGLFPTALHAAIAGGDETVMQLLVSNDLCHEAAQLGSLIQSGFHYRRYETVDTLLRRYFNNEVKLKNLQDESIIGIDVALQAALYETKNDTENYARVHDLVERVPDINEPGGLFGNALQAASLKGLARWVRLLLERGADPNSIGYCGSALRAASFGGHDEVVRLLLERGATLGPGKQDALEACALKGQVSTLKLLVEHFSLEKTSDYSESKRHFSMTMRTARRLHRTRIINFLVQNGAGSLRGDGPDDPISGEQQQSHPDFSGSSNEAFAMLEIYLNDTGNVRARLHNPAPPPPPPPQPAQ
ncbi:Vegetative incompatibility protein HET-E-1 [Colletotrichum siamense]|uniref:Vegetative incompatibility protein HET-E-1 n=1 Tax=Colletotrichum siamense TaxID=690259 RepID=A0A9P5F2W7_COLSI|nr:Vegetative incompatibility protein HET-E-1 [Colletotrichum siamense]KAF4864562.1 Vegetative incompatibility protein HET-E-1 [Colletotrichum siamense]